MIVIVDAYAVENERKMRAKCPEDGTDEFFLRNTRNDQTDKLMANESYLTSLL